MNCNALITDHVRRGQFMHAIRLFERIQGDKCTQLYGPTFVALLKACIKQRNAEQGEKFHAEILRMDLLNTDYYVGSTLVDMYAKCGVLSKAQEVFDMLPVRNVVSWTTLITGYVEHGDGEMAIYCFEQMQHEAIPMDVVTFVCSIKACSMVGAKEKGNEIFCDVTKQGMERNLCVGSTLVDMYSKCGMISDARKVFDELPVRNVVTWTALIAGYTEQGHGKEALRCFDQMQREGVDPDSVTFVCGLKACSILKDVAKAREIHTQISRKRLEGNLIVGSTLVDMYAKFGLPTKARDAFDKLPIHDVVSWTALIAGYAEYGDGEEALECLEQMHNEGVSPGSATYVCGLKACGTVGSTIRTQEIHISIVKHGSEKELLLGNALLDAYAKCGSLAEAHQVLDELDVRDIISWTALITGYSQLGESDNVFYALDRLAMEDIKPNLATFVNVINACNHAGLVETGEVLLEVMFHNYELVPTIEHYTCLIDLLGRAGSIIRVLDIVERMPFHPGIVVWHAILGACRKWGNAGLGRRAFEHAVLLNEKDVSSYVAIFNIYADASMHDEASKVEALGVKNQAFEEGRRINDRIPLCNSHVT